VQVGQAIQVGLQRRKLPRRAVNAEALLGNLVVMTSRCRHEP
jgi:hypothetical protein